MASVVRTTLDSYHLVACLLPSQPLTPEINSMAGPSHLCPLGLSVAGTQWPLSTVLGGIQWVCSPLLSCLFPQMML